MVVEATSLLDDNPDPTEREVREAIDDNVCRCTGYQKPVEAILDAADRLDGGDPAVATDGGTADGGTTDDRTADPANGGDADE
jgi:carbon-monoxide dehydrogenase small subunit